MENFKKIGKIDLDLDFYDGIYAESITTLQQYLDCLNNCFDKEQNNFAEIVYYVYQVKNLFDDYNATHFGLLYTKSNKAYTFDDIMLGFGLDKTQVCRLINTYCKFLDLEDGKPVIKNFLVEFSKSKIFELLGVDNAQIQKDISNNVLRPDMSVKQIREYVKNYKALEKQNKKLSAEPKEEEEIVENIEEDIPLAYDPKKHYEFEYFEKQSKAQLLNIVWELQKEYERIVSIKKNKK